MTVEPHTAPPPPVRTFIAIGDSFTEGLDDPQPGGGYGGWADRLADRLAEAHPTLRYANLAVRGKLIAGFLFCFTMLGLGAGPALVGALTTLVFASDARIGTSMMIVVVGCYGIAFVTMRMALLYLKPAIERAEGRG